MAAMPLLQRFQWSSGGSGIFFVEVVNAPTLRRIHVYGFGGEDKVSQINVTMRCTLDTPMPPYSAYVDYPDPQVQHIVRRQQLCFFSHNATVQEIHTGETVPRNAKVLTAMDTSEDHLRSGLVVVDKDQEGMWYVVIYKKMRGYYKQVFGYPEKRSCWNIVTILPHADSLRHAAFFSAEQKFFKKETLAVIPWNSIPDHLLDAIFVSAAHVKHHIPNHPGLHHADTTDTGFGWTIPEGDDGPVQSEARKQLDVKHVLQMSQVDDEGNIDIPPPFEICTHGTISTMMTVQRNNTTSDSDIHIVLTLYQDFLRALYGLPHGLGESIYNHFCAMVRREFLKVADMWKPGQAPESLTRGANG